VLDVELFAKQFYYEAKRSTVHDIQQVTKNKRIPTLPAKQSSRVLSTGSLSAMEPFERI
jgi:hypothetical protein